MDRSNVQKDLANEAVSIGHGKRSSEQAELPNDVRRTKPKMAMQQASSSSSSSARALQPTTPSIGMDFSHSVINAPIYFDLNSLMKSTRSARENKENDDLDGNQSGDEK